MSMVSGLILLERAQAGDEAADLPADARVMLTVRDVGFKASPTSFRLQFLLTVSEPGARRPLLRDGFELRFTTDAPRPFDLSYISYGLGAAA